MPRFTVNFKYDGTASYGVEAADIDAAIASASGMLDHADYSGSNGVASVFDETGKAVYGEGVTQVGGFLVINGWSHVNAYDEYFDFDRELYSLPDKGNTSVDIRLTFNVETLTAYVHLSYHNDDGNTKEFDDSTRYIPWVEAMAMLGNRSLVPAALLEADEVFKQREQKNV